MVTILNILSSLSLWVVVALLVIYIDPVVVKDLLIPGLYMPMLIMIGIASAYTSYLLTKGRKWIVIALFVMVVIGVLLLL